MTTTRTDPALEAGAAWLSAGVRSRRRLAEHVAAESTNVIDEIMSTVAAPGSLTWSGGLSWAMAAITPAGPQPLAVITDPALIRDFYTGQRDRLDLGGFTPPVVAQSSDAWSLMEVEAWFTSKPDGRPFEGASVLLGLTDGDGGISGEISLNAFPGYDLGPGWTTRRGVDLHTAYLAALAAGDVDGLLALMLDGVQGAVRDFTVDDGPCFVAVRGADQMRRHYQAFFDRFTVRGLTVVTELVRSWWLFDEILLDVDIRRGPAAGVRAVLRSFEVLPLWQDRIAMRLGQGQIGQVQ
jgi:hypothetical protein